MAHAFSRDLTVLPAQHRNCAYSHNKFIYDNDSNRLAVIS